ncbi:hypothetical protein E5D57_000703 [Metarhizium anisopliae]|nr:hypothetical protein E5D57_000703 [Metarhizium anisopliae]
MESLEQQPSVILPGNQADRPQAMWSHLDFNPAGLGLAYRTRLDAPSDKTHEYTKFHLGLFSYPILGIYV